MKLFGTNIEAPMAQQTISKGFYWLFLMPLSILGPATILYTISWICGVTIPFVICSILSFMFCAVPYMSATVPQ